VPLAFATATATELAVPLALATAAIVLLALLSVLVLPRLHRSIQPTLRALLARIRRRGAPARVDDYDPGRELRAEQRARALLRSCVNEEEWAMYRDLGFLRVRGTLGERPYAYLVYPHKPILAYVPGEALVLGEYCVEFPDHTRPYGSARLPDADDVLAKWVALTSDERALIERANMHLPGRQIRVVKARRDLARLECWERERLGSQGAAPLRVGSVPVR
jgi:hypothetical protein